MEVAKFFKLVNGWHGRGACRVPASAETSPGCQSFFRLATADVGRPGAEQVGALAAGTAA
eukprot:3653267-Pleurochrysis_carterae.AAC.3